MEERNVSDEVTWRPEEDKWELLGPVRAERRNTHTHTHTHNEGGTNERTMRWTGEKKKWSGEKRKWSVLISDPRESECRRTERRTTEGKKERRQTLIGLLFTWSAREKNGGATFGLGRRFRSISGSLFRGVTERRREEGSAGSQWRRTWEGEKRNAEWGGGEGGGRHGSLKPKRRAEKRPEEQMRRGTNAKRRRRRRSWREITMKQMRCDRKPETGMVQQADGGF